MPAEIINGKSVAQQVQEELKQEVAVLSQSGIVPGLATILVGDDPASQVYIKNKIKACETVGVHSVHHHLPIDIDENSLVQLITKLNEDINIDGILVQLPLPKNINADKILVSIKPEKDVDGFHPVNIGKMNSKKSITEIENENVFVPCTPYGIIQLLRRYKVQIAGSHAVVIGRSNIVGKPIAMLLLAENATVTIVHSQTYNLPGLVQQGDIIIAAVGKPKMVTADMVADNSVVIDVGVNRLSDGKICGDVDYESVYPKVKAITPVPGGVGPMTITMLMANTVKSARFRLNTL